MLQDATSCAAISSSPPVNDRRSSTLILLLLCSARAQVPLKEFVGLDFTPTMEVEVVLDPQDKAVVFRSVRSTLYGNIGKPGEEGVWGCACCLESARPASVRW